MPITDSRFKRNNPETVAELMDFLRPNFHVAYTLDDLVTVLNDKGVDVSAEDLESMLGSLVYGGRIIAREVEGETHYQYRKVIGFMPMKRFK